ncbi:nucleoside-diphosphate-sugar epimerase [Fontibacillus phaseoli]|uniref:Nucleoside-diphosphate-sugar epimerase n=1 Tax=Fontibacillus phaseoli TaxID=1416533 RepID=A0A369B916_9BACL|nr:nucleoside-diphosphate-sugar epimerase [Fontibacillus phaseoli]
MTVATRGLTEAVFNGPLNRLIVDRTDESSLVEAAKVGPWDIVYDNICYSPNEALAAVRAFDGNVGRYVLTSTLSVYKFGKSPLQEEVFDPYRYEWNAGDRKDMDYGEGKRQAEAVFFQQADFPVAAMRIPIVLGPDDYTRRLHFHVERVMNGTPIGFPNVEASMSYISSAETASFLKWLGCSMLTGPVNASSDGELTIAGLLELIGRATGKQPLVLPENEAGEGNESPFGIPSDWVLDISKAKAAGYSFGSVMDWLPDLIGKIAAGQA